MVDEETVKEEVHDACGDPNAPGYRAKLAADVDAQVRKELEEELWLAHDRAWDRRNPSTRMEAKFDEVTTFAVGAQVIHTVNQPPGGFVNGDLGVVIGFRQPTPEEVEAREQEMRPLDESERVRSYPLVRFARANSAGERELLILPYNTTRSLYRVGWALRRKLPLRLAWAISVHKSQGMSLPRLRVELASAFATGQCYVALSRATTIDGLCIASFDRDRVLISHEALRFHDAVRASTGAQSPEPLGAFWLRSHFWWKDVLEGPRTHAGWPDIYRSYGRFAHAATEMECSV